MTVTAAPRAIVTYGDHLLPKGKPRVLLAVVAVVLAVGAAVGATMLTLSAVDETRADDAGKEATATVLDLTPKLLNYDFHTIDADLDRAKSVTTGDYWAQNALAGTLKPAVVAQEASTHTVVQAAGVADAQPDRVVVLVYLNQTTTGKDLSAPRVDSRVARVTATRADGKWLLAAFEPL